MKTCRLCGSERLEVFRERASYPLCGTPVMPKEHFDRVRTAHLRVGLCLNCSYVGLVSPGIEEIQSALYEGFYISSRPIVVEPGPLHDPRTIQLLNLISSLGPSQGGSVLEIGSYDGHFLWYLRERGWAVTGCEPNEIGQEAARRLGLEVRQGYFSRELFADVRFDRIVARYVLEHVPDPVAFLEDVRACLKPGGVAILEVPDDEVNIRARAISTFVVEHTSYFGVHTLTGALQRAGFQDIRFETYRGGLIALARRAESTVAPSWFRDDLEGVLAGLRGYDPDCAEMMAQLQAIVSRLREDGKAVAVYGANSQTYDCIAEGGVKPEQIAYIVDDDTFKQGLYLFDCDASIHDPGRLETSPVEAVLVSAYYSQDLLIERVQARLGAKVRTIGLYPRPMISA